VTTDAGVAETGYVFAGEHPLFRYDQVTGQRIYYLQDAMGSTIGLANGTAAATSTIRYDAFGNESSAVGGLTALPPTAAGDFRFQGMWLDSGTGLYYARARIYESVTGRFHTRDPVAIQIARPETLSGYAFVGASPTYYRDPSGRLMSLAEFGAIVVSVASLALRAVAVFSLFAAIVPLTNDDCVSLEQVGDLAVSGVGVGLAFGCSTTGGRLLAGPRALTSPEAAAMRGLFGNAANTQRILSALRAGETVAVPAEITRDTLRVYIARAYQSINQGSVVQSGAAAAVQGPRIEICELLLALGW
jgi:RHS repeat-associated protein